MVARFTLCDTSKLQLALAGELPEAALGELSRHLQSCPHCREELDTLAGGEHWASDARQYLSSSDELVAVQEMTPPIMWPMLPASDCVAIPSEAGSVGHEDLDFLFPSDDPAKLGRLGSYEIESVIGRGGFGIVLKAFDPGLNRYVAIKALSGTLVRSSAARKRFNQEAKAAAGVVHDHVIPIHHIDTSGPSPFLVMPFVTGRSLQERIDELGPLETKEVLRIAMQTAQGLAAAHAQGLVHRDVKPANILLENGVERVRITDFGLARAVDDASQTQSGYIAGTPQYMAPEQARGESIDARADLFSLGSVIYAMCSGHPPFRAETTLAVLRRICDDEPRPLREINPDVPAWLAAIVERLLAKNAAERFQSAEEVAELLGKWLAHVQQPTQIPPPVVVTTKTGQRNRISLSFRTLPGLAIAMAAGMLVAALYAWLPGLLFERVPVKAAAESREQKSESSLSKTPSLETVIAAVRSDQAAAESIELELREAWHELHLLESAISPAGVSGSSLGAELEQLRAGIERLEHEQRAESLPPVSLTPEP
ncbi:MAG TPA: protein kinase [Pirellulaceae bacterium]|nr:protein kinase [Pirellulaceae bacterium]